MTARELITIIDSMKPNAFSDAAKLQWVNEAEGYIWTEVMLNSPVTFIELTIDGELMVKPPHSELYWPYLMAMIDLANGDYERYTNSMQLYNDRIRRYMRWYTDNYRPADNGETAEPKYEATPYAIALERGYEGTEEQWRAETAGVKTTAADVIAFVDSIKPDVFSDAAKLQWINEVESHIWTEVMLNAPLEYTAITEDTMGGNLLAPAPHSDVYWPYLCALIDFANGDYDRYANTMELYTHRMRRYMRWYADNYRPADGAIITPRHYISAYGIAVAHGFSGTEEDWLASLKGDKGDTGPAFTIADVYPSVEALKAAFPDGAPGIYAVDNTGYIYSLTANDWIPYGSLQGPAGPQGPQGDNYNLTEADKEEIAEIAAELIDEFDGTIAWDNVTGKPFEGGTLPYVEWDGDPASADVVYDGGTYDYYRVSTARYETFALGALGRLTVIDTDGNYNNTEIGGNGPRFERYAGSNNSFVLYAPGGSVLIINELNGGWSEALPNGIYYSKNASGYVWMLLLYDHTLTVPETLKSEALPKNVVTVPNGAAADMVPVSNGAGGVTWVSRDELGGVEEELPPNNDIVVEPGVPGWTYVPNLSPEGDLGFTPTRLGANEGPTEVLPVNIRGPRGPAYELTEEDKAAIVEAVKSESLFDTDATLKFENGVLGVNTATDAEQDNTLPITSAAVYETLGNIEILLGTI